MALRAVKYLSSLDKSQMLGSVIGLQAVLQHSPFAFVVYQRSDLSSKLLPQQSLEFLSYSEFVQ